MQRWIIVIVGLILPFLATVLGAAAVFIVKGYSRRVASFFFGATAGIMVAASVWSLLLPSLESAASMLGGVMIAPVCACLFLGAIVLYFIKKAYLKTLEKHQITGAGTNLNGGIGLFIAMTLHNVPEGLAVGFAFGAALLSPISQIYPAFLFSVGIALQNLPEGAAVSLPLLSAGLGKGKSFFRGVLSGLPELAFAIMGLFMTAYLRSWQPWLLSFSAGTMLFVSVDELLKEKTGGKESSVNAWGFLFGFALMMALDVVLG